MLVGFVWKHTRDVALAATRREMVEQSDALLAIWRDGGARALAEAVDDRPPGDPSLVIAILGADGHRRLGYAPTQVDVPVVGTAFRVANLATDGAWGEHDTGYVLTPIGAEWLLVGRNLDVIEAEQHAIERALALAITLSLALGIGAGLVLARYVGGRLDRIARVIEAAGEGDLSRRVPTVAGRADAFDRLAARLNAMLGKVERLMGELRIVTDSLAHDLRSPLARLRTKTEQAVMLADPAARDAALSGLLVETDLVMRMLTMVIEITRAESVPRTRFTTVDPSDLVEEIADLYEPVAEDAGLTFRTAIDDRPAPMPMHRELVSQALINLIDNALKYGAAGGEITLRLLLAPGGIVIRVEDRGPGIAEGDRTEALRRFGRLDVARTKPGAGLGMALIEAVARLHGGHVELADNAPGLIAGIFLPR